MTTTNVPARPARPGPSTSRAVDDLQGQLASALLLCAADDVARAPSTTLPLMLGVVAQVWGAGAEHVPALLIVDFAMALWRGRAFAFASGRRIAAFDDDERAVRLAFEDRVVAPWLLNDGMAQAHIFVASLPETWLQRALAHAALCALPRLVHGVDGPVQVRIDDDAQSSTEPPVQLPVQGNAAAVRALVERWSATAWPASIDELEALADVHTRASLLRWLRTATPQLAARTPLQDEELWELAHLQEVPSEALRLALRSVHATHARIGSASSSTTLLLRRRAREVPVDATAADVYPAGGFDAMSTRGTLENLVRSEVAWVGEGTSAGSPIDLFDVRYVEGELLYYTRDDSPMLEEKRRLHVVIDDPARLRHKVRALPTQTLVLAEAMALRAHADLVHALGPLAVTTTITLCGADDGARAEEASLLAVSLAAEIAHQRARVQVVDALHDVVTRSSVVFSAHPPPPPGTPGARWWVHVGATTWVVYAPALREPLDVEAAEPGALRALLDRIVLST